MTKKLIEELRGWTVDDAPNSIVSLMHRAADALAARQPTEDEETALAYLITAHRFKERGLRGVIKEPDIAIARPMARFLLGEGFSRAAVPDAATEEAFKKAEAFDKAVALSERRQTLLEEAEAERDAALAAIERVREIHRNAGPSQGYDSRYKGGYGMLGDCCATCGWHGEYGVEWPCPTIAALDGAPEPEEKP